MTQQEFGDSVRFVFFETDYEQWAYATDGGTAFVVNFNGKPYGLTARHVLKGFDWKKLIITERKFGSKKTGIRAIYYPSSPNAATVDTDILDVVLIEFGREVVSDWFEGSAYVIDSETIGTSQDGDRLFVVGALKETSEISETEIIPQSHRLELTDNGPTKVDPTLRHAIAVFADPAFSQITGLSGSPVFNATSNALCGMVVRGGLNRERCDIRYVDIFDIMRMIEGVHNGQTETNYKKTVAYRVP
jgi:hypothetical protein